MGIYQLLKYVCCLPNPVSCKFSFNFAFRGQMLPEVVHCRDIAVLSSQLNPLQLNCNWHVVEIFIVIKLSIKISSLQYYQRNNVTELRNSIVIFLRFIFSRETTRVSFTINTRTEVMYLRFLFHLNVIDIELGNRYSVHMSFIFLRHFCSRELDSLAACRVLCWKKIAHRHQKAEVILSKIYFGIFWSIARSV